MNSPVEARTLGSKNYDFMMSVVRLNVSRPSVLTGSTSSVYYLISVTIVLSNWFWSFGDKVIYPGVITSPSGFAASIISNIAVKVSVEPAMDVAIILSSYPMSITLS